MIKILHRNNKSDTLFRHQVSCLGIANNIQESFTENSHPILTGRYTAPIKILLVPSSCLTKVTKV